MILARPELVPILGRLPSSAAGCRGSWMVTDEAFFWFLAAIVCREAHHIEAPLGTTAVTEWLYEPSVRSAPNRPLPVSLHER